MTVESRAHLGTDYKIVVTCHRNGTNVVSVVTRSTDRKEGCRRVCVCVCVCVVREKRGGD